VIDVNKLNCFKAYDIRGELGSELNEDIAYRIGRAYAQVVHPKVVVVGGDVRLSSAGLKMALANGLMDAGVDVLDLGVSGTEEVYFATFYLGLDGGIEVTASHNPINFNGMKLVRAGAQPVSGDSGLREIEALAASQLFAPPHERRGTIKSVSLMAEYVTHLMSYIDTAQLRPLKLVINSGNGAAGHVIDAIEAYFSDNAIPIKIIKVHHTPDGSFPNGIPNPLLPELRHHTADAVKSYKADMGIAFDGDFDRCFLFDHTGEFIEGYYIVGLLAEAFLQKNPREKIIHDPRLMWNTQDVVANNGGQAIMSKTGHAFIKERMRSENAIYGGEMSAHHYFRDFSYCDSGMIPWLKVAELLSIKSTSLRDMVKQAIAAYPSSGEINRVVANPTETIQRIRSHFEQESIEIDETDGLSMSFEAWRFNVRSSNTEAVVRLNVESRGDIELVQSKTAKILTLLEHNTNDD
jgi:phosphomannomutase